MRCSTEIFRFGGKDSARTDAGEVALKLVGDKKVGRTIFAPSAAKLVGAI